MTARDEARRGRAEGRDGDRAYAPEAGPTLPQRLIEAREHKGVDLLRAERDTKIRAKYLAALEQGNYAALPGAVYTKGFLRNYALYLGLDPEDVTRQWKRERGDLSIPAEPVLTVPKPLAAPRQAFTFSPVVIVAVLLTVLIGLFAVYIGVQLIRYAKPPTLEVTTPAQAVIDVAEDATSYTIRGTSIANATVTIIAPGRDQPYQVSADATGRWSVDVDLRRGRNEFDVKALDPQTGKNADTTAKLYITVPFTVTEAPTLSVDSPSDGARFQNGAIPIKGQTTNAKTVAVSAILLGQPGSRPTAPPTARPGASGSPSPSVSPGNPDVGPVTVDVAGDGSYETPLDLAAGSWQITVTATSTDGKAATITRNVSIQYQGVNVVVTVKAARAWLKVWVDGKISTVTGIAGTVFDPGKVLTFTGKQSVEVRTGKSSATYFTLNGQDLGHLSTKSNPETWLFGPTGAPTRTNRT